MHIDMEPHFWYIINVYRYDIHIWNPLLLGNIDIAIIAHIFKVKPTNNIIYGYGK